MMNPLNIKETERNRCNPASLTALLNPESNYNDNHRDDAKNADLLKQRRGLAESLRVLLPEPNGNHGRQDGGRGEQISLYCSSAQDVRGNKGEFGSTQSVNSNGSTISTFTTFPFTSVIVNPQQPGQSHVKRKKISPEQLEDLLEIFEISNTPDFETREKLAKKLNMSNREIQIWFQNRRAKANREKAEMANRQKNHARYKQPKKTSFLSHRTFLANKDAMDDMYMSVPAQSPPKHLNFHNQASENQPNYKQRIPPPIKILPPVSNIPPSPTSPTNLSLSPLSQSRFSMQALLSPLRSATKPASELLNSQWHSPTRSSFHMTPITENVCSSPSTEAFAFTPQPISEVSSHKRSLTLGLQENPDDASPFTAQYSNKRFMTPSRSSDLLDHLRLPTLPPFRKRAYSMGHIDTHSMDVLALVAERESSAVEFQGRKRSNSTTWNR
ncbi:hypothetical protein K7432_010697 [Basidiobolus ranarum]|uniref:Homeobox domain-containing protein n=1 Tax=Basidiobolus ranarum TaxID=34480 RepID=A0ABR2WNB9_9FUNG